MPLPPLRNLMRLPARARSREVASFFAQMDDLSRRTFADLKDCTPAELAWQPRPGNNTIGMLLAHNAIVEAFWIMLAPGVERAADTDKLMRKAIGIGGDDDGMPLPAGGAPPRALRGWSIADFRRVHDRARRFAKRRVARVRDADLEREIRRIRPSGQVRILNGRWILYHVLEHQAGHYGQMLLLRHLYRDRRKKT
jgi:uncharacterized damage-inducible protein DinB